MDADEARPGHITRFARALPDCVRLEILKMAQTRCSIEAALFDLDGTLVDSADDILLSLAHTIKTCGLEQNPNPESGRKHLGHPLDRMLRMMGYSFKPEEYDGIVRIYAEHYMAHWKEHTKVYDGIPEMLGKLAGLPKAIVTQKRQFQADAMAKEFGLSGSFDCVVGMGKGLNPKPSPDLLLRAADLLGIESKSCVMIGDSPLDIHAARAAGMSIVGAAWGFTAAADLKKANPDFLAETPMDAANLVLGMREGRGPSD